MTWKISGTSCNFSINLAIFLSTYNTKMRLKRGHNYGLLFGENDSGKTTLMRAIANNQVEGFPDVDQVRTVLVEG